MEEHNWPQLVWDALQWLLAVTGTTASSLVLWLAAHYREHVAMLMRHDETLNEHGEAIAEHTVEHKRLHKRINTRRAEQVETEKKLAEIQTDIRWMRRRMEHGE